MSSLLETGQVDINAKDLMDKTPLYCAAERGHHEVVALLLGTGQVDVNAGNTEGCNPILPAFRGGHLKVVKLLLDNGWEDKDWGRDSDCRLTHEEGVEGAPVTRIELPRGI